MVSCRSRTFRGEVVTEKAELALRNRNPDVLTCIANLSNDEVFTPPELARQMLDLLADHWARENDGANVWADPNVRFLDPCTKSGVFLREITSRLVSGLSPTIPDLHQRVDHILTRQVFGIGITRLTALLSRRSVYCSKWADGKHSVARSFDGPNGNIWFEPSEHTWVGGSQWIETADSKGQPVRSTIDGRCRFCGASQQMFSRDDALESHAYEFIHTDDIRGRIAQIFGTEMKFDVVIGNPPYQMNDGGGEGASAIPLYHRFVEQAKALEPSQLVMVIPARWYSGGKGLDDFRDSMLHDQRMAEIHDFPETGLVFPGVNIRGGVSYFLWSQSHSGLVKVVNYRRDAEPVIARRPLLEPGASTFVRYNEATSILSQVRALGEPTYGQRVQSRNPFGIPSNFADFSRSKTKKTPVLLFRSRRGSIADKEVYISESQVKSNQQFRDRLKVLVSKASPGGDEYPHAVLGAPIMAPAGSVCTETYLIVDFPTSSEEAKHLVGYMQTRFFRFMVQLIKTTQNISKGSFAFVPVQDLSRPWSDAQLYEKYQLSDSQVAFIESMVRPMDARDE
jgi:hypothetical protein